MSVHASQTFVQWVVKSSTGNPEEIHNLWPLHNQTKCAHTLAVAQSLTPTHPEWLSTREVADRAGVTVFTVAKWVRAGKLAAAYQLDGRTGSRVFDPSEVDRFLAERAS